MMRPPPSVSALPLAVFATPKLAAYAGLSAAGLLLALVLGRVEPLVLAGPFLLTLTLGLALAHAPQVSVTAELERDVAVEGDHVELRLEAASSAAGPIELWLSLPADGVAGRQLAGHAVRLRGGEPRRIVQDIDCDHWGGWLLGEAIVRAGDAFGLVVWEHRLPASLPLRVYPRAETLQSVLAPAETQAFAGNELARQAGAGIEFAAIREFAPGDRTRQINWRVSARRDRLHVNEQHLERNADVVLFLDSFDDVRNGAQSTLDLSLRAAIALVSHYLEQRDRVGLIGFGGTLRWLTPGMGVWQRQRIAESLLDTRINFSYTWKDLDVIPNRALPPKALVVALSPLLDQRTITALLNLRQRRFDLAIIEVSPLAAAAQRPGAEQLGHRLWLLEREALRGRYRQLGIPVAVWQPGEPLQEAIEEVRAFRRYARHAVA